MGFIYDSMKAFFAEEGWPVSKIGDHPAFSMTYGGEDDSWPCIAQAVEEQGLFLFYSASPVDVPENRKEAIGLFLSYVNYTCLIGNFELDQEDGELRFRTGLSLLGIDTDEISDDNLQLLFRNQVYGNTQNMEFYLPGIKAVIAGEDPAAVIKRILGKS